MPNGHGTEANKLQANRQNKKKQKKQNKNKKIDSWAIAGIVAVCSSMQPTPVATGCAREGTQCSKEEMGIEGQVGKVMT